MLSGIAKCGEAAEELAREQTIHVANGDLQWNRKLRGIAKKMGSALEAANGEKPGMAPHRVDMDWPQHRADRLLPGALASPMQPTPSRAPLPNMNRLAPEFVPTAPMQPTPSRAPLPNMNRLAPEFVPQRGSVVATVPGDRSAGRTSAWGPAGVLPLPQYLQSVLYQYQPPAGPPPDRREGPPRRQQRPVDLTPPGPPTMSQGHFNSSDPVFHPDHPIGRANPSGADRPSGSVGVIGSDRPSGTGRGRGH